MKTNIKIGSFILFTLLGTVGFAQQDPQFTQYMYNTISVNPGYAGSREALTLGREIKNFRKDVQFEDKFGWYYRYRKEKINSIYGDTSYNTLTTNSQKNNDIEDFDISNMF